MEPSSLFRAKIIGYKGLKPPLLEYKRKFDLPKQYPSTATPSNYCLVMRESEGNKVLALKNDAQMHKNVLMLNKMEKARLKTLDGKDLGEIKVKPISRSKVFRGNFPFDTSLIKNKKEYYTKVPIVPVDLKLKLQNSTPKTVKNEACSKQSLDKGAKELHTSKKNLCMPIILKKNKTVVCKPKTKGNSHSSEILSIKKTSDTKQQLVKLQKSNMQCDQVSNTSTQEQIQPQESKNSIQLGTKVNPNSLLKKNNYCNNAEKVENICLPNSDIKTEKLKCETAKKLQSYTELTKSKYPIVRCKRLKITDNKIKVRDPEKSVTVSSETKTTLTRENDVAKQNSDLQNKNVCSTNTDNTNIDSSNIQQKTTTLTEKIDNPVITEECQSNKAGNSSTSISNKVLGCVSSSAQHKNSTLKKQQLLVSFLNKKGSDIVQNNNVECIDRSSTDDSDIKPTVDTDDTSMHWNIIKEALVTVSDRKLRTKALKALSSCRTSKTNQVSSSEKGLHTEKQFPVQNKKTTSNCETQTDAFDLANSERFSIAKDNVNIRKKKHEVATVFANNPTAIQSANSNIDNKYLFSRLRPPCPTDSIPEIDRFFNEYFSKNENFHKVRRLLSIPHSFCKKVLKQLHKDFEEIHNWDEIGMLNIHRAVLDNNLRELQRLLVILNAAKISIDVLTKDGLSALELAVKTNASKEIVTCLLKEGAKPVSAESTHESAIVLACKQSSSLLPEMLKYVKNVELLNRVDSLGFAPLHYCTFQENVDGVAALIVAGADINLGDYRSGRTPFFHALERNKLLIAHKLFEYGADVNVPNFAGQTVLHIVDEAKSLSLRTALKEIII